MKIAFILSSFPNLSNTFILNQITGLIDRGHSIDIYAFKPGDTIKKHENVDKYNLLDLTFYWPALPSNLILQYMKAIGLMLTKFSKHPKFLLQFLISLKYLKHIEPHLLFWSPIPFLRSQDYDIIHCHFGPNGLIGALLRDIGIFRGKLITTFHGYDINRKKFDNHYYKWLFQHGDFYTSNTSFTEKRAVTLGCPPEKIAILPTGIDISKYSFKPRYIGSSGTVNIITVARLAEEKGIEYSIKAIAKVIESHPNINYQIIGDGYLRKSLVKLISDLGISINVELLGWKTVNELTDIYDNAHLFVLSSVTGSAGDCEGQGLVIQEAQALGLPILSSLLGGIPEGMIDGKSGFLVPEKNIHALAEKLKYLIEHPELWPEIGRTGRKFVESKYDIEILNDKLFNIYKALLQNEQQ
jgi:colanic acid/amylovoran biosynthesis glycosyltransferase